MIAKFTPRAEQGQNKGREKQRILGGRDEREKASSAKRSALDRRLRPPARPFRSSARPPARPVQCARCVKHLPPPAPFNRHEHVRQSHAESEHPPAAAALLYFCM